ncbi:BamA/TamA family outer membrane protein [Marinoscillum sp. MHG1-6]|uniref:BamA/TamA family outer membrane protein n=1 Tax=Marinoscillum sp. MHG1-6 TaxID=2959627 RepID=UPI0021586AE5|nr:BamA/TamA family outer membrane protein [Marinoscillum sp. MHG1-6]
MSLGRTTLAQHVVYLDSQRVKVFDSGISQTDIEFYLRELQLAQWSKGYLFCQIFGASDSSSYLHRGKKYWFEVDSIYDLDENKMVDRWRPIAYKNLRKEVNEFWIDKGYPFATFQLNDIHPQSGGYRAALELCKGPYIVYDSLYLINPIKSDLEYVEKLLDIETGQPFKESDYKALSQKLSRLPYATLNAPPDVSFSDGKSIIYLDIEEQSSSSFEGIIGFLPNQANGGLLVTGYLDLYLSNLFGSGKEFSFQWNRFAQQSQSIDLSYRHPYLIKSNLLLDVDFHLFKQDTGFLNQDWKLKLGAYIGTSTTLKATYHRSNTNLITLDQQYAESQNIIDFQRDFYGLELNNNSYEWPFDFRGGFKWKALASLGQKQIQRNPNFPDNYYDSIKLKTNIARFQLDVKNQFAFDDQLAFFNEVSMGWLENESVLNNEAYRIGGFRSVRGFNENEFYARKYLMSRMELRQYFERSSYFMLFYDQLLYQGKSITDYPFGLGLGFALSTKSSLFNFAMAVGKSEGNPMSFSTAKIHFGYISRF